jgi:hypothetical protein
MVAVATGGPPIHTVNDEYNERRAVIAPELRKRGLDDPNPHSDLWVWYGRWRTGDMPTYQSRREYLAQLYEPLLDRLRTSRDGAQLFEEPIGWPRVDRGLAEVRRRLNESESEEQFQAVGLLCREVLISVAQAVYDTARHPPTDGVPPSNTDAKRMLDAYAAIELAGGPNEGIRRHAKAALALALDLQHRRTATYRDAALCSEATISMANIVAIISGRRDRPL